MDGKKQKDLEKIFRKIVGKHIQHKRKQLGKIQEKVAENVDCSTNHYGRIERGEKTPKSFLLTLIQLELNINSDDYAKEFERAKQLYEKENGYFN